MYNKNILLVKQMIQIIDKIFEYTKPLNNSDEFEADNKTFDATLMNFISLGETVGKLTDEFRTENNEIEWRKIYAFRNNIAHDYFGIDAEEVFEIVQKHLPKFQTDLQKIITKNS